MYKKLVSLELETIWISCISVVEYLLWKINLVVERHDEASRTLVNVIENVNLQIIN